MVCQRISTPAGAAIVCSARPRRQRCKCGRQAMLLCDWKLPGKKSGTCDAPICTNCATSPAPEKDLCPQHAEAYRAWLARQAKGRATA